MGNTTFKPKIDCPKIICIGRNYVEHIKELNNEFPTEAVYFLKPFSAISNSFIWQEGVHYEGEICFRIEDKKIVEVAFGFDLTLREVQKKLKEKGLPWERAKAFRASAIFSDFVPISSWHNLEMRLYKNGELVQKGSVELMIYKPDFFLKDIDDIFGLNSGDIIMSGTPKGVGKVDRKDIFVGEILQNGKTLIKKEFKVF